MSNAAAQITYAEQIEAGLVDAGYFDDATAVEILDACSGYRIGIRPLSEGPTTHEEQNLIVSALVEFFPENDLDPVDSSLLLEILEANDLVLVADVDWADDAYQLYMRQIFEKDHADSDLEAEIGEWTPIR